MDQVTLIELLNNIATGDGQKLQDFSEKEVFINDHGEATDRFLEALKLDIHNLHNLPSQMPSSSPEIQTQTWSSASAHSHSHSHSHDLSTKKHSRYTRTYNEPLPNQSESEHEEPTSYLSPTHSSRLRSTVEVDGQHTPDNTMRRSRSLSPSYRILSASLSDNHVQSVPVKRKAVKKTKVGVTTNSVLFGVKDTHAHHAVKDTKVCSRFHERSKRASVKQHASLTQQAHSHSNGHHAPKGTVAHEYDDGDMVVYGETEANKEALQAKLKSLTLRCTGQRNTIKTLEAQISGNLARLTQAHEILVSLQHKNKQLSYQLEVYKDGEGKGERVAQLLSQLSTLQTHYDQLQHQHQQLQLAQQLEVSQRKRGEEREKTYRIELNRRAEEATDWKLRYEDEHKACEEAKDKCRDYRKAYKELASQVDAIRAEVAVKETDARRERKRAEDSEQRERELARQLAQQRESFQAQQHALRQLQFQVDVVLREEGVREERAKVQRVESRLKEQGTSREKKQTKQHLTPVTRQVTIQSARESTKASATASVDSTPKHHLRSSPSPQRLPRSPQTPPATLRSMNTKEMENDSMKKTAEKKQYSSSSSQQGNISASSTTSASTSAIASNISNLRNLIARTVVDGQAGKAPDTTNHTNATASNRTNYHHYHHHVVSPADDKTAVGDVESLCSNSNTPVPTPPSSLYDRLQVLYDKVSSRTSSSSHNNT
eukprot:gene23457-28456_t